MCLRVWGVGWGVIGVGHMNVACVVDTKLEYVSYVIILPVIHFLLWTN